MVLGCGLELERTVLARGRRLVVGATLNPKPEIQNHKLETLSHKPETLSTLEVHLVLLTHIERKGQDISTVRLSFPRSCYRGTSFIRKGGAEPATGGRPGAGADGIGTREAAGCRADPQPSTLNPQPSTIKFKP